MWPLQVEAEPQMKLCRKWMPSNRQMLGHTQGDTVEAGQGLPLITNIPTGKASQGKAHRGLLKVTQLLTGRSSTCLITQPEVFLSFAMF